MPKKLPAAYRLVHREEKWGQETKDTFIRRPVDIVETDQSIVTTSERTKKRELREDAIAHIEKRFTTSKKVKVGVPKPGSTAGVYAAKVFDFIPNIRLLVNKTAIVQCDDSIESELTHKQVIGNNDFLLHQFKDSQAEDTKLQLDLHRSGLYKFTDTH